MISYALKAFSFISIKYPKGNFGASFYIYPLIFSLILTLLIVYQQLSLKPTDFEILFLMSVFDSITTFIQILPGFYIGALAAIASYDREGMDDEIPAPTPYLKIIREGRYDERKLSRRTYLTLMFSYLASMTLFLAISIFILKLFYSLGLFPVPRDLFFLIYSTNIFVFFFIFFQILTITLVGIYYLGNRMHRTI